MSVKSQSLILVVGLSLLAVCLLACSLGLQSRDELHRRVELVVETWWRPRVGEALALRRSLTTFATFSFTRLTDGIDIQCFLPRLVYRVALDFFP